MGIKHLAVKTPESKGLSSEWNDNHTIDGDVDFNQYEALQLSLENLPAPPIAPVVGQIYFDTTLLEFRAWDGTAWTAYVYTTKDQTIAGIKTFSDEVILNGSNNEINDYMLINGDIEMTSTCDFINFFPTTPSAAPTADYEVANKKYVDDNSLENKTSYTTIFGGAFQPGDTTIECYYSATGGAEVQSDPTTFIASIQLPHGAVVTGAVVYGADTEDTWILKRMAISDFSVTTLASGVFNTEDVTISNATIDNSAFLYFFETGSMGDNIYGARVKYTTLYD